MINILLENSNIHEDWIYDALKQYIRPEMTVCVLALSYRKSQVQSKTEWDQLYGRNGKYHHAIALPFQKYGIRQEKIIFIDPFLDRKSMIEALQNADILYFPGGMPDLMMDRIAKLKLTDVVNKHSGIKMGFSAGALIQLQEYHLSPDEDYLVFQYSNGFDFLRNFYLEVHYAETFEQCQSIQRVLTEKKKDVYAIYEDQGAMIVHDGNIALIGKVKYFDRKSLK